MSKPNLIAIDLAKNVFQFCHMSPAGKVLTNKEVSRAKLKELLFTSPPSLVAMEACSGAHYWARLAQSVGHTVKVINPKIIKGFQFKQKTDKNDALAIATAASLAHIHSSKVLTINEQTLQSMDRVRSLAIEQQRSSSNQIRALLFEFGITVPQGSSALRKQIPLILEDAENGLPTEFRQLLHSLWEQLQNQMAFVQDITIKLENTVKSNPICNKLMQLEGVGPICSLALYIRLGNGEAFKKSKDASACVGLTPRQHSSGGKERIGGISKTNADKRLRSILFQGALSVINHITKRSPRTYKEQWLKALIERRGKKLLP
ncbi:MULTISPECIES: IS110 family transposase [Vibrio]|uniref:IS110 family transposase n=1 Tax=Vibrio TaxID=662 RepID=UPI0003481757|nr:MULTISPECIES: IS110 family transposase [Vibrio]